MDSRADTERPRTAAETAQLLDQLARDEWSRMLSVARSHGADRDSAADVVQSALVAVLRSYSGRAIYDDIRRYAYRAVKTETWRFHRRHHRRQRLDVSAEALITEPATQDEPADFVERAEEARDRLHILRELPQAERTAVLLIAAGYPRTEVRQALELSERALRKRITRANRRLSELRGH